MKHGFIKVAAATPKIKVADTQFNTTAIIEKITEAYGQGHVLLYCRSFVLQDILVMIYLPRKCF